MAPQVIAPLQAGDRIANPGGPPGRVLHVWRTRSGRPWMILGQGGPQVGPMLPLDMSSPIRNFLGLQRVATVPLGGYGGGYGAPGAYTGYGGSGYGANGAFGGYGGW
jgi:hypothetical protein